MKRAIGTIAGGVVLAAGVVTMADGVGAVGAGTTEGCTPGYWKNHPDAWQEADPDTKINVVFHGYVGTYAESTMMEALRFGGGGGADGAARILLRAATAAWLNAAWDFNDQDPLDFPWQRYDDEFRPPLVATVVAALNSGNRQTMLNLAAQLDADNNLGCPLGNGDGGTTNGGPTAT